MNSGTRNKPRIGFSRGAENVVRDRASENVQRSILTNSILIRYESMVNELYQVIEEKFDPAERQELVAIYTDYARQSGKALWFFDSPSHITQFCRIFRDAMREQRLTYLNATQAGTLLDILEKHLTTTEFLTLCDWICLQTAHARKFAHVGQPRSTGKHRGSL